MSIKKQLLSEYIKKAEMHDKRHKSIQNRMEERRIESANLKESYMKKTNSLTRLRNK